MALTKEDLLAISQIFSEQIKPLDEKLTKIEERMTALEERVTRLEERMAVLEERVTVLEGRVSHLEECVINLEGRATRMELLMENDMLPRLQNIEACYTSTYKRYAHGTDQIETMQEDINTLKKVVQEHSEKLKRLA